MSIKNLKCGRCLIFTHLLLSSLQARDITITITQCQPVINVIIINYCYYCCCSYCCYICARRIV